MNKKKKFCLIYHPLILAIYPLLFFYSNNQSELKMGIILTPLIISLLCSLGLWLVIRLLFLSWRASGVFVSLVLLIFFSYGHVAKLLENVFIPVTSELIIGPHKILMPLVVLLTGFVFLKLFRSKPELFVLNKLLNIVCLMLLVSQIFLIFSQEKNMMRKSNVVDLKEKINDKNLGADTPDIYYIVLDAYARADILEELYGYDNSEFVENSAADVNYMNTVTFKFLGRNLNLNEFYIVFLQTTALSPLVKDSLADQARSNILYAFDKLTEIPYQRGKKMVIAHINSPHPPYLFDENGEEISEAVLELAGESFSDRENYLKQLKFVNKKVTDTLKKIIERSENEPVIILQSDHGPASILGHPYKWTRPHSEEGIIERMSILYAYYGSEGENLFGEEATPVNTFRMVFDKYFETEYGALENINYFSDYNYMYEFFDVTDELGAEE
jgi:hypothetical protein